MVWMADVETPGDSESMPSTEEELPSSNSSSESEDITPPIADEIQLLAEICDNAPLFPVTPDTLAGDHVTPTGDHVTHMGDHVTIMGDQCHTSS